MVRDSVSQASVPVVSVEELAEGPPLRGAQELAQIVGLPALELALPLVGQLHRQVPVVHRIPGEDGKALPGSPLHSICRGPPGVRSYTLTRAP